MLMRLVTWFEDSPFSGTNGTMFTPRAHIPQSEGAENKEHDMIEVKSHRQKREALEEHIQYFVVQDLGAVLDKEASGKLSVEWWQRELEGDRGAHVVYEDGTNVWWEIAEVRIVDEDPGGV
jgi:hypothetical protein